MNNKTYKYLFGPVPSRRFGRSLGVDLIPLKTCTLNCVFCQLGRTKLQTIQRKAFAPVNSVINELTSWIKSDGHADYITLSGSGEPTLHSDFGDILQFVASETKIPSVLLTNGTLFYLPEVREAASQADVVKISFSVWNQKYFSLINRPHETLKFDTIYEGIKTFRNEFSGQIWIEVFLIDGMNGIPADVKKTASLIKEIKPDKIQLNTAVRPPAESFVKQVSRDELEALSDLFEPTGELIPETYVIQQKSIQINEDAILNMLKRRPCTAEQISQSFGLHINETLKYLGKMIQANQIRIVQQDTEKYFKIYQEGP